MRVNIKTKEAVKAPPVKSVKRQAVDALITGINKDIGEGRIVIQRGSDIGWASADRLSTGSLGLDIAMNGGVPVGMICQFFGEEASGKTTMAFKVAAYLQAIHGADAAIAVIAAEGFDKKWANLCGCRIPFTEEELRLMPAIDRDRFKGQKEIGTVVVAQATTGEDALELALRFIRSAQFHLVIVDSLAALVPSSEEEREMSENTMGKLPAMIGKFLRKCGSALATPTEEGVRNSTAVILINQVRDPIGVYGHPEPQPTGGRALRHWSVANVRFKRGELLKEGEGDKKFVYGKRTKIRVEKSKIGPPYREAEFDFFFEHHAPFNAGDIDTYQEIRLWGVRSGLIKQTGNTHYDLDGKKFLGKAAIEKWLRDNAAESENLRTLILRTLTTTAGPSAV